MLVLLFLLSLPSLWIDVTWIWLSSSNVSAQTKCLGNGVEEIDFSFPESWCLLPSLKTTQVITQCFCSFLDSCLHPYLPSWWYSSWVHVRRASQQVLVVKNPPANEGDARDAGSIPGLGRSPGVENDNSLQYSCLENPMDGRARRATVHGAAKSWTWLSAHTRHGRHSDSGKSP